MARRRAFWAVTGLLTISGVALLAPFSPFSLSNLLYKSGFHDGHFTGYWVDGLDNPDRDARRKAIFAVGAIGNDAGHAVPKLAKIMVEDEERESRIEASLALSKMVPASKAALPQLSQALEDKEPFVRLNVATTLVRLGPDAKPAIPALIKAIADEKNQTNMGTFTVTIQEKLAIALGRATAGSDEGVGPLTELLDRARTAGTKMAAARALGEVGPPARSAVPRLRALLKDNNSDVREAVEEALQRIGEEADKKDQSRAPVKENGLELAEAERQYLWDVEHHGNVLVKHGFGPLATALAEADAAALARLLAEDFVGSDLEQPRTTRATVGDAEVERLTPSGQPPRRLGRDAFVARLLELRRAFPGAAPTVKGALMALGPKTRGQLDGPWEAKVQLRLHGEQAPGAPAEAVLVFRCELPPPTEERLGQPGWLRSATIDQLARARAPRFLFQEVAPARGLDTSKLQDNWQSGSFLPITGGTYVTDFNRDGLLDLLVTDINGSVLYQGRAGGGFEDVTVRVGLPAGISRHPGAAWVDLDGDGWDDLIVSGRVYRNEQGRKFIDYTDRSHLSLPNDWGNIVVADYDRDGKLDLYVTRIGRAADRSWLDDQSGESHGNYLFRNKGDWQFEDVTRASGTMAGYRSTFTAAWLDANDDGWPDLHVINELGDGVLLVNNGNGTFREQALADRPVDFGSMGLAVGDVNNDGRIDLYCANMYSKAGTRVIGNMAPDAYPAPVMEKLRRFVAGSQLHLNRGGLKFDQVGPQMQVAAVGWAYGACLADLDNDGWLDIYATAGFVSRDRDQLDG